MKRLLLLTFLLITLLSTLFGQMNFQIGSSAKWIEQEERVDPGTYYERYNYALTIKGDTLVNDTLYLKMYMDGEKYWWSKGGFTGTVPIINRYYGAVFADSNRIFMVFPDSTNTTLLYNFNYSIGDTISSYIGTGYIIQNIDTLNNGRKLYTTNYWNWDYFDNLIIIEGIGSNWGLIGYRSKLSHYSTIRSSLGCFYQHDSLQYTNNQSVCNYSFTGMHENHIGTSLFIYPNPVNDILNFEVGDFILKSVIIYNVQGSTQLVDNSGNTEIDISILPPGLYIIRINNKYSFKVIKN